MGGAYPSDIEGARSGSQVGDQFRRAASGIMNNAEDENDDSFSSQGELQRSKSAVETMAETQDIDVQMEGFFLNVINGEINNCMLKVHLITLTQFLFITVCTVYLTRYSTADRDGIRDYIENDGAERAKQAFRAEIVLLVLSVIALLCFKYDIRFPCNYIVLIIFTQAYAYIVADLALETAYRAEIIKALLYILCVHVGSMLFYLLVRNRSKLVKMIINLLVIALCYITRHYNDEDGMKFNMENGVEIGGAIAYSIYIIWDTEFIVQEHSTMVYQFRPKINPEHYSVFKSQRVLIVMALHIDPINFLFYCL